MTRHISARFLLPVLCLGLLMPLRAAEATNESSTTPTGAAVESTSRGSTESHFLKPTLEDGRIAFVTARLLEQLHYSHHIFNDTISSELLDRYLESLDPQHLHFLQSDLDQFEIYRTNLDNLTITRRGVADTSPAFVIFARFVERLKQRVAYADDLLQHAKFEFNTNERIVIDRHELPWPKNLKEAKELWRQRLRYEYLQEKLNLEDPSKESASKKALSPQAMHEQIVRKLTHRYHRNLRLFTDWDDEDVMGVYLTALAHVYDPHSDYFNGPQFQTFMISMSLELPGIGAQLTSDDDGYCKIQALLPGGPAIKSKKLKKNDRIIAVAQSNSPPVNVVDMSLNKIVQLIRGPKGTEVRLTIVRDGDDPTLAADQKVVSLIRDEISLEDQAAKGKIIDLPDPKGGTMRLGIIDLPSFYASMDLGTKDSDSDASYGHSTSADVAKLLKKFNEENVRGVILDLRRNGGGSLPEAIRVTGLFIKKGPVVQVCSSDGGRIVERDRDPSEAYEGPLIVLTSRLSASASEIVAGALQDYGRALIVGDISTHGKGTVQNLNPLSQFIPMDGSDTNNPGALKITIRKFYRASGASTQLKGVAPDIVLPSVLNVAKDIGEKSLENPLPWDTIQSTKYDKLNLVQPYLPELLKLSNERVATNQDFIYVRQDIERYRKLEADKTVSLNEKERLKEMKEDDARTKARDEERMARKKPDIKIYDISLEEADQPGLPAPEGETNSPALKIVAAGDSTNSVALNSADKTGTKVSSDDADEDQAPKVDVDLDEAERIMMDYVSLLPKDSPLLATQSEPSATEH